MGRDDIAQIRQLQARERMARHSRLRRWVKVSGRARGKIAFITGAARGQGRSHAVRLAAEGADIIAVDMCKDVHTAPYGGATVADLDETVGQVLALGRRIVARTVDVRDYNALQEALNEGVAELGGLDIVCANAGIFASGSSASLTEHQWTEMIDINLTGVWKTVKAAIPHLVAGGRGGAIVLISSAAGLRGMPNLSHYSSAKHALVGLTRSLANELGGYNIRVNSIHPGLVRTDMTQNEALRSLFMPGVDSPTAEQFEVIAQSLNILPTPWIESIDISNALLFLVSDEGRFITGTALPVDAGVTQK
jgi:(+)-trans-carveol dehydrogenase